MKIILILFLVLCSLFSLGQKTKTLEIWKKPMSGEVMNVIYSYNEEGSVVDTSIMFMGQNSKYVHITDFITIYKGSASVFYKFLNEVEKFCLENEAGISGKVMERNINRSKFGSYQMVEIEGQIRNEYYGCPMKWISKFKSKFVAWCKKNNIAYE